MDRDNEIIIARSKFKVAILALCAVGWVAVSAWLVQIALGILFGDAADDFDNHHPAFVLGLGLVSIVFGGFVCFKLIKKLFDDAPGLVIDSKGILDNSSAFAAGFIPWDEITTYSTWSAGWSKSLAVFVRNPDRYINRGGFIKVLVNRANYSMSGSSIYISAASLKIKFDELESIFQENLRKYGDFDRC